MTETEMYEYLRAEIHERGSTALEAMVITLKKAGIEVKKYYRGEKHLFVRCDNIHWGGITIVAFLAASNGLKCRIVALPREVQTEDRNGTICTPYINIYKV